MGSEVLQVEGRGPEEAVVGGGRTGGVQRNIEGEKRGGLGLAVQPKASHCPLWALNLRTPDPCTSSPFLMQSGCFKMKERREKAAEEREGSVPLSGALEGWADSDKGEGTRNMGESRGGGMTPMPE